MKRSFSKTDWRSPIPGTSLDAAGLIALADLNTIAHRTVLSGSANLLDALVLCPGIHRQQKAPDLNCGELPPTAALTTGYVFRVENQATVVYLQSVGIKGHLVSLAVEKVRKGTWYRLWTELFGPTTSTFSVILLMVAMQLTVAFVTLLMILEDWWGSAILLILIMARLMNIILIRRRTKPSWHGALEPGKTGDLLILLSQDRWLRMQGSVDALKTVTAGQWLSDMTFFESFLDASATILVYISAALATNASQTGKILLMALLLISVGLLGICNQQEKALYMHGLVVKANGKPKHMPGAST